MILSNDEEAAAFFMVCDNVCLDLSPLVSAIPVCVIPGDPDGNPDRFGEYPVT